MAIKFVNTVPYLNQAPGGPPAAPPPAAPPPAAPPPAAPPPAAPPPAAPPAAGAPPWGADPNARWMVDGKPWFEAYLPEGPTRDLFKAKDYANPVVSADAYFAANKLVSGNTVEVPADGADPKAWDAFYTKLGRPEAADKYDLKMPDGVVADDKMLAFGKDLAFKLGLPPAKAQAMADAWNQFAIAHGTELATEAATKTAQDNAAEFAAVQTKWGADFDAKANAGKRVVSSLFDVANKDPAIATAEAAMLNKVEGAIGAAAMMELFARIGSKSGEGGFKGGDTPPGDNIDAMTPQQATAEINRLRADPVFDKDFSDPRAAGHAAAVEKMNRLYAKSTTRVTAP